MAYMLEITMESRNDGKHRYIRRSFPVSAETEGILDIKKYGEPYSTVGSIYLNKVNEKEGTIRVPIGRNEYTVHLNGFTTVVWDDGYVTNMGHVPATKEVYITFYLYIE